LGELYVQGAAIIGAIILLAIAIFQVLLFLGFPWGEYSWGGRYSGVLPKKLRIMSLPSAIILLLMGFVFLIDTKVVLLSINFPTHVLVYLFTVFLGLNTLGNLASKSRKEKLVMSPLSGIAFIACLVMDIF
jgi:hypothetical protein